MSCAPSAARKRSAPGTALAVVDQPGESGGQLHAAIMRLRPAACHRPSCEMDFLHRSAIPRNGERTRQHLADGVRALAEGDYRWLSR